MNKKLIVIILISSSFLGLFGYVFYQTFYKYQSDVDQILAEIPAEDKELPPNVLKVFRNTSEVNFIQRTNSTNIRILASDKHGGISKLEWHIYGFAWEKLLAFRIGEKEEFGYFANKIYFGNHKVIGDIVGFKQAAQFYFKKDWNNLTEEECLVLMVFSNSPQYVRNVNSESFRKKLNEFNETYYKNTAK